MQIIFLPELIVLGYTAERFQCILRLVELDYLWWWWWCIRCWFL